MEEEAPKSWKKLRPYIDNNTRNSFAHGMWAEENKQIVLFKDAKLELYEKLGLADFMIKAKEQNVLYICLSYVIARKMETDFFNNDNNNDLPKDSNNPAFSNRSKPNQPYSQ